MDWIDDWEEPDADVAYEPAAYVNRHVRREPAAIAMTTQVTTKVPPSYDGKTSWFSYEDAIDDWCDITELEDEKRGPALRNRLEGEAAVYKRVLDRDALKANDPPGAGVEYFKRVLRPYFVKGSTNVFLYRFMQFVRFNRGSADMMKWMTRFQILLQRLMSSWMDMLDPVTQVHPQVQAQMQADAAMTGVAPTAERIEEIMQNVNGSMRILHQNDFPLGENLIALLMLSLADLSQDQRNTLTSLMTHRGRVLQQYTTTELRTVFIEMFCTTKTSVDNPLMQPTGAGGRRSFLVLDEGELNGTYGYWAEDEEDGTEGFLDALDDVFWVYDEQNFSWLQRRFQGRRARKGKGKGRRKGKGKGRSEHWIRRFSEARVKADPGIKAPIPRTFYSSSAHVLKQCEAYFEKLWEEYSTEDKEIYQGSKLGDTCLSTIVEWGHSMSGEEYANSTVSTKEFVCKFSENFALIDTEVMCSRPSDDDSHGPMFISLRPASFSSGDRRLYRSGETLRDANLRRKEKQKENKRKGRPPTSDQAAPSTAAA